MQQLVAQMSVGREPGLMGVKIWIYSCVCVPVFGRVCKNYIQKFTLKNKIRIVGIFFQQKLLT